MVLFCMVRTARDCSGVPLTLLALSVASRIILSAVALTGLSFLRSFSLCCWLFFLFFLRSFIRLL